MEMIDISEKIEKIEKIEENESRIQYMLIELKDFLQLEKAVKELICKIRDRNFEFAKLELKEFIEQISNDTCRDEGYYNSEIKLIDSYYDYFAGKEQVLEFEYETCSGRTIKFYRDISHQSTAKIEIFFGMTGSRYFANTIKEFFAENYPNFKIISLEIKKILN